MAGKGRVSVFPPPVTTTRPRPGSVLGIIYENANSEKCLSFRDPSTQTELEHSRVPPACSTKTRSKHRNVDYRQLTLLWGQELRSSVINALETISKFLMCEEEPLDETSNC